MVQPTTRERPQMRGISLEELKSCPKFILSPQHWYPVHKVEECGANEAKEERIKDAQVIIQTPKRKPTMFQDVSKQCVACKANFIWTAGEQKFINRLYDEGKITAVIEPKRCPDCRKKKKEKFERQERQES